MTPTKTGFEWLADYEYIRRAIAIRAELEARPPVLVRVTRTAAPLLAPKHERPGR